MALIINIPAENSNDSLGCRKAPKEIISNLDEIYTNESGREIVKSRLEFSEIDVNNLNYKKSNEKIYRELIEIFDRKDKIIVLGGDHSITYSCAKAFLDNCRINNESPFLVVFDAHPDCKSRENGNNKDSENAGVLNNVQWLRALVESGFPAESVILVGLRNSASDEVLFLNENKIRTYAMKNILDFQEICDIIMELANKNQIYVSIDIDVVDAVFVPGTARPEISGFSSRQLIYFIQRLNLLKNLRIIDICEINPEKDLNSVTVKLGAKLLGEVI